MKYKVEVLPVNEDQWCSNGLVFDTKEKAEQYGSDLLSRWSGASEYRVVEVR